LTRSTLISTPVMFEAPGEAGKAPAPRPPFAQPARHSVANRADSIIQRFLARTPHSCQHDCSWFPPQIGVTIGDGSARAPFLKAEGRCQTDATVSADYDHHFSVRRFLIFPVLPAKMDERA
jgi:hypothetical protein